MQKRAKRLYRACAVFMTLFVLLAAAVGGMLIAEAVVDRNGRFTPQYEKTDLSPVLAKETLGQEDYDLIYRQTGLTKLGVEAVKDGLSGSQTLLQRLQAYQEAFFHAGEETHEAITPITQRDIIEDFSAPMVPLQTGDVLITSGTHTIGFRHGHAAIVLNEYGTTLESISLGTPSTTTTNGYLYFTECSTFLVLRLKDADADKRAEIADAARRDFSGVPYSLTVGIFSKKNQGTSPKKTQCAHLVWQAFYNFGYDLDYDGGILVTPQDLARSPLFEVVQEYGFDPDKLW